MRPRFDEKAATQLACLFLQRRGGKMSFMKLIKLMYLVDRESLIRWGSPVTYDLYFSMNKGPVLSLVKDLITEDREDQRNGHFGSYWSRYVRGPVGDHEVELANEPEVTHLSKADVTIANEVFETFGQMSRWDLVDYTHTLPEWTKTLGAIPIEYSDILKAAGKSAAEIESVIRSMEGIALADTLLGVRA